MGGGIRRIRRGRAGNRVCLRWANRPIIRRSEGKPIGAGEGVQAVSYTHLGGKVKVPCLRIEEAGGTRWMYESNDIIAYLEQRYANVA